jgi:dTDP-4-amino-4,6-dideoxygalactose transaminase
MKRDIHTLAILGGKPLFDQPLHVGKPNIPDKAAFMQQVDEIWESGRLTNNGPKVAEFESAIQDKLGVKHCIAICNATRALEIAIRTLDMNGEVIVPSFTFVATAHSLQWQGITPIFCDIDPVTHCLDPDRLEGLITPRTTGIVPVHLWGNICKIEEIARVAEKHGLALLYDASHAFGCSYDGNMVGGFGDAEVFSFHATKIMTTFEGGCITTNNDELASTIRLMKNFGFSGRDNVIHIGTNGKMSEISAAMGLVSLQQFDDFVSHGQKNYAGYLEGIDKIDGLNMVRYLDGQAHNYHYIVFSVDDKLVINRDQILKILEAEKILARRYFYPGCHRMEPYKSFYPNAGLLLPVTEAFSDKLICLPNSTATEIEDVEKIVDLLRFIIDNQSAILNHID